MKIVVLPGVGFQNATATYNNFMGQIKKQIDCEIEMFYWKHDYEPLLRYPLKDELKVYSGEVILDFQQVIRHATEMKIPFADYYIGHSAGGIISLVQGKKCVIMGCPASLIEIVNDVTISDMQSKMGDIKKQVFNIVNNKDVLGYIWDKINVENYEYSSSNGFLFWKDNPLAAHSDYWTNSKVIKKIVEKLKNWENLV